LKGEIDHLALHVGISLTGRKRKSMTPKKWGLSRKGWEPPGRGSLSVKNALPMRAHQGPVIPDIKVSIRWVK